MVNLRNLYYHDRKAKAKGRDEEKVRDEEKDSEEKKGSDSDSDSIEIFGLTPDANVAGKTLKGVQVRRSECNYSTVCRWRYRVQEWEKYMAQTSTTDTGELKLLPDAETFLFAKNSNDPAATSFGDNDDSVENLIWGAGEDSLKSLHDSFQRNQAELAALQSDNSYQLQMCSQESTCTSRTVDDDEQESNAVEIPSNLNLNSEQLAWFKSMQEKTREAYVKANQEIIKQRIQKGEAHIKDRLARIQERHEKNQGSLSDLTGKGNETAGTGTSFVFDTKRFNEAPSIPLSSPAERIRCAEPDTNFLKDLLKKEEMVAKQGELCGLQAFMATLMDKSIEVRKKKGGIDKRIQASVDAILEWETETTVQSQGWRKKQYGRPPPTGCETIADQPILCALIFRILDTLGQSSKYVGSEHVLAPVGSKGRGRRIDFIVDENREFLHVLLPEMLGLVVEVKSTSHHNSNEFQKNQEKAREQVIGHMAKRLLCAFDFAGVGQDDVMRGVVLSMTSVQVLEMQLTRIGTHEVDIVFRQTPHVPLLGGTFAPETIREAVKWDMESNGMLLLASAMLDISRTSLFGRGREQTKIDDISAANYYSSHGQEGLDCAQHVGIEMQSFLGSGTFAHVVHLGEDRFMKIPRSRRMVQSLTWEHEILQRLMTYEKPRFPRIMPWGVSVVNLSIRSQISEMNVLRLQGIVGCSLSRYCKYNPPEMRANIHRVIQDVYEALHHAHTKGIFHMDVRPSNIIVKGKEEGFDVLLADWGCSLLNNEKIGKGRFVGCTPYAHDVLLGDRKRKALSPEAKFDFASLGYTWYHVIMGVIDWKFDRPHLVTGDQLQARQMKMERFFQEEDVSNETLCPVPELRKIFVKTNTRKRKSSRSPMRRTSRAT